MKHWNRLLVALCVVLAAGTTALAQAQASAPLPQWSPSPALLKKLGAPVNVEGFLFRPPENYKLVIPDEKVPEGVSSFFWVGPQRQDKTQPILMVNLIVPTADEPRDLTLAQVATRLLKGIHEARRDWTQTPMETGLIQGLKFVRVGWTGVSTKEKRKMQGWLMVTRAGDTLIELASQDIVPYTQEALPLAETSARTFTRLDPRVFFAVQWPDHAQIYAMNPDGSKQICLTPLTDSDYAPALSSDGATLAFTSHRDGVRSLYLMNLDGTNQRRITQKEDAGICSWSPDGNQLAFSSNRSGRYCIYVMKADGSNVRKLTDGPSDDFPAWSPDGTAIAYEGRQDKNWQIYVVPSGGGPAKAVTSGKWSDRWPQWSPDSALIAYTSYEHGKGSLYLMKADGTLATRLTTTAADDQQPTWTADGRQLLFHSNRAGKFDIYSFDLEGGQERRLTTEPKDTAQVTTLGRSQPAKP
jgi:hypothetical protein